MYIYNVYNVIYNIYIYYDISINIIYICICKVMRDLEKETNIIKCHATNLW